MCGCSCLPLSNIPSLPFLPFVSPPLLSSYPFSMLCGREGLKKEGKEGKIMEKINKRKRRKGKVKGRKEKKGRKWKMQKMKREKRLKRGNFLSRLSFPSPSLFFPSPSVSLFLSSSLVLMDACALPSLSSFHSLLFFPSFTLFFIYKKDG